ncbi:MAG: Unknown protein [uncultured Sulfurovum sp.]|uniref:Uncharacterized protein n=1 Tax=uncultured Sulfurovum sp. TaxID=269237 RepID=A0A6S6TPY5_9BACT|nr:MAG: Unknown protein [uncultured Sulfurovum sp.]
MDINCVFGLFEVIVIKMLSKLLLEIEKILDNCNLIDRSKTIELLKSFGEKELFETLFYLAIEKQEAKKNVFIASLMLYELNTRATIELKEALSLMLKAWDISIEEVVFYVVEQFGVNKILEEVSALKKRYRQNEEFFQRIDSIEYWTKIYEDEYLTQRIESMLLPIKADSVLSPKVYYDNEQTGIYFFTEEDKYARITFENLDSIKVSRGEMLPLHYDWSKNPSGAWGFKVKNSTWLQQRYEYEKKHYGEAYEFGGDVEDMKKYFSHYIFSFHDQFVEVIAKGFWVEESKEPLFEKALGLGHPFKRLTDEKSFVFEWNGMVLEVCETTLKQEDLIKNTSFCTQKILECYVDKKRESPPEYSLVLSKKGNKVLSELHGYLGNREAIFNGLATFLDIKPYVQKYMDEVAQRRKEIRR